MKLVFEYRFDPEHPEAVAKFVENTLLPCLKAATHGEGLRQLIGKRMPIINLRIDEDKEVGFVSVTE